MKLLPAAAVLGCIAMMALSQRSSLHATPKPDAQLPRCQAEACPCGGNCQCPAGVCPNCPDQNLTAAIEALSARLEALEVEPEPVTPVLPERTADEIMDGLQDAAAAGSYELTLVCAPFYCQPCNESKEHFVPWLEDAGWTVTDCVADDDDNFSSFPTWVVTQSGVEVHRWTGAEWSREGRAVVISELREAMGIEAFGPVAVTTPAVEADAQPTPYEVIFRAIDLLDLENTETLIDFGCGDARVLIHAFHDTGCRGVGIELDPDRAASARNSIRTAGLSQWIEIVEGDAVTTPVNGNVGFVYLWSETLEELRPKLQQLDRFVSYAHAVPGLDMQRVDVPGYEPLWYWERQPEVSYTAGRPYAVYNGRRYYSDYNPGCNCSMCRTIRSQLASRENVEWIPTQVESAPRTTTGSTFTTTTTAPRTTTGCSSCSSGCSNCSGGNCSRSGRRGRR